MKTFLLITIMFFTSFVQTSSAHAYDWDESIEANPAIQVDDFKIDPSEITPINSSELKLLGRGLEKRGTHETLGMACEDSSCTTLRFVYFLNEHVAAFIGDPIIAPTSINPKVLKRANKLAIQEYIDYHPTQEIRKRLNRQYFISFLAISAGVTAVVLSGAITGPVATITIGAAVISFIGLMSNPITDLVVGDTTVNVSMTNENKWSWSENPHVILKKSFNLFLKQIVTGNMTINPSGRDIFTLLRKYDDKKSKLEKRGASFPMQSYY